MKSDESHAGKDSVLTEQTEKASNKKDAKRRQRGYEKFGTGGSSRERKNMEGRGLEIRKRTEKSLPPLSAKLASVQERENKSSVVNTKVEKRVVKKQLGEKESVVKPSLKNTKAEKRVVKKFDEKESAPKPNEYEEDALLLKKRVPSGQSCSAFFLGDASTASPVGDAKSDKKKLLSPKPVPQKNSSAVGSKLAELKSQSNNNQKTKMIKSNDKPDSSSSHEKKESEEITTTSTHDRLAESTTDLRGNEESEPTSPSADDDPKTSPSALTTLKSQLLSLSSHAKLSKQEDDTDLASPTFDDQPIDSTPTLEESTESDDIEETDAPTLNEQPTIETEVAEEQIETKKEDDAGLDTNAETDNGESEKARLTDEEVDHQPEQTTPLDTAEKSENKIPELPIKRDEKSASGSASDVKCRRSAGKESSDNASPNGEAETSSSRRAKGGKKKQMTMSSFLGKQSKIIDEEAEYVEDEKKLAEMLNEERYAGLEEQASDEFMDLHVQATLSDCEFSSVQSSVTTDKILEAQPSIIKRTSSLIRNPLLRRNRSKKKSDMDELVECMNRGKLAAKADNDNDEFDEQPSRGRKPLKRGQGKNQRKRASSRSRRSEVTDDDVDDNSTPSVKVEQQVSDDIEEMYDLKETTNSITKRPKPAEEPSQSLISKGTFDDGLTKKLPNHGFPNVDTSAKIDMKSPSFRMSAVSGTGTGLQSPLAQQIMLNALNENTASTSQLQSDNTHITGAIGNAYSIDHGTQTSATSPQHIAYQGPYQPSSQTASASSFGTFGDVVETIGLFSARLCLGTGAAIVSCSRACNDNPKCDMKEVRLDTNSFIEPNVDVFSSPRNVGALSPIGAMSPRNDIFREGPRSPISAHNGYTQALADAISKMPEEDQMNIVRQLSSKSYSMVSPRSADMDMISSVDGMFGHRGMSGRMKKVPHNIAVKPKQHDDAHDIVVEEPRTKKPNETKQTQGKKPLRGFRKGIKRLAKTRLAVMYQV